MPEEFSQFLGPEVELIDPIQFSEWILEEEDGVLAINKPGLIVCHPSKNGPWSSLIGAAREYLQMDLVHLVHRLDRETSGVCVLAKDKYHARILQMAFQLKQVCKEYVALLEGELSEVVELDNFLAKDLDSKVYIKQTVRKSHSAKRAHTLFSPIMTGSGYTLAKIVPETGRKHQIRVHAAFLGHPLVGDKLYGPDEGHYLEFIEKGYTAAQEKALGFHRHALHAFRILFDPPQFSRTFKAPLHRDMVQLIVAKLGCTEADLVKLRILGK
ncbi:MAG: RNA pseudouridine synthase [Opitutaceae bacterium]|nr:RNA pseudouridine synthase [Opitutaceae bacterium]|tara:strand:+ start:2770 stop:3579 length:810 start_codon:yes stop_codon:yes gene_type:complete